MISKDSAYNTIEELVIRFNEQLPSYKKADYNETLARRDFIDPFFKALGWDIDNSQGYAEAYREVIHEDKIKIAGATKAPDYSFRLPGGKRLFFVEAKKPSVVVKEEILPAYQVRRYAWSAKLPVSILTDFEEFAVYDCTKKPSPTDKASAARIKYLLFKDYLNEFDFLWDTFSKERVLKGSFDKFIASDTHKKGTATVDAAFLESLDEWRKQLALNIALRNQSLNEDELNFAVQQTLDRIIFLRIAEDRSIEDYERLKSIFTNKSADPYNNLLKQFYEADSKYNSGLFDFKKDKITSNIAVDGKTLKHIITDLYYPNSPYEFSVLSVEILGSAYEQFLGKQIKLNAGHRAVIEEKPEVRKAGGVYYTPQYIVDYIVENTVGKLVENKKPEEIAKLKIVDPACGSGSFLLGAYQYLLNKHRDYYKPFYDELTAVAASKDYTTKQRNDAIKDRNKLPLTPDGNLTTALKKQILLNNIYGVDIDVQAVEVTKLSLLLKCMEGETGSSITAEMRFGERILPTLDNNIKSGNSLVDVDFYDGQIDFEPGIEKKVKPFNWQQAFPEVFKHGGFDAVIGNPPYLGRSTSFEEIEKKYIKTKFEISEGKYELYQFFIEKACKLSKGKNAFISFITPQTWLSIIQATKLRKFIISNYDLQEIIFLGKGVFNASVDSIIFRLCTGKLSKTVGYYEKEEISSTINYTFRKNINIDNVSIDDYVIPISQSDILSKILNVIKKDSIPLQLIGNWYDGVKVVGPAKDFAFQNEKVNNHFFPMYTGSNIERYSLKWSGLYCCRDKQMIEKKKATDIRLRDESAFDKEKILVRKTGNKIIAAIDSKFYYYEQSLFGFSLFDSSFNIKAITAILNSRLASYILKINTFSLKDTFPQIRLHWLKEFPIKRIETETEVDIIKLVNVILKLNQQKQEATLTTQIEQLEQQIKYTDKQIDQLVYQLYNLTEEEIKIIEAAS